MKKILYIEDEIYTAECTKEILEMEDFEVVHCATGDCALNIVRKNQFDLIITDIWLGGENGLEVYKELKEFTSAPLIIVSADTSVKEVINDFKDSNIHIIPKPLDVDKLMDKIEELFK